MRLAAFETSFMKQLTACAFVEPSSNRLQSNSILTSAMMEVGFSCVFLRLVYMGEQQSVINDSGRLARFCSFWSHHAAF